MFPGGDRRSHAHGDAVRRHQASDTFETGTRAAAWGGTTTIVDFVVQYTGQNVMEQYARWHEKAAGNCAIDYGFHQILSDVQDESLHAMDELVAEGVTSFKLFMAYKGVLLSDDGQILRAFQKGAENGVADDDARGERRRDRRARRAGARGRTTPRRTTTGSRAHGRRRRRRPTGRS